MPIDPITLLRASGPQAASKLAELMGASRPTLSRAVHAAGNALITRGRARRTRYAARRALRGSLAPLPLFRIDREGTPHQIAELDLIYPDGTALSYSGGFGWPLEEQMLDGWFDGLPYPMQDMRPQGFLGRHFARHNAAVLQVNEDPAMWSDDDVLYALSILGDDTPGDLLVGAAACRRWLDRVQQVASSEAPAGLRNSQLAQAYPKLATMALELGVAGSSAGGEFPKFTALRQMADGALQHVLVKFSGSDDSPGTQRWADLLVCEHLAGRALEDHVGIATARSRVHAHAGRTFLEVDRFDRHGTLGRSPMVSWAALNNTFIGNAGRAWGEAVAPLVHKGWVEAQDIGRILRVWLFGQLIGNNDMHDGNLSFLPAQRGNALQLAPIYDMLPMMYAPVRGVELPPRIYAPRLPLPADAAAWQDAARAALAFWELAASDQRISASFRKVCGDNAALLGKLARR
ncbi:type II toxin-antitoxin system HipA family toxin YjjJ [Variovorax sp. J22R133]|uniref:type II toxin-antitoxin system HipA family toxin YjjJ n=1 Tax=Variovorax brevis TaxID=3053503 RepID=UPI0025766ECB|nr:type II toxin-antitoxin system HipA family toxin YjjJ [Variovorax sp. J22R133]MDM0114130.1 type II toxin-antitoxin system HipA family toxin YjjJ [Variovorax sp. J22R133]